MAEQIKVRLWHAHGPEAECEWPVGLPRTFDEMFREFGDFIAKKVASYNKVQRNFEDLYQEVCCKLIGSDLLNRFVERQARTLPRTMYAREAAAIMGVSFDTFQGILCWKHHNGMDDDENMGPGLDFGTVDGKSMFDDHAVFNTSDIRDLDEVTENLSSLDHVRVPRSITWPLQALGFRAYLTQAIHNHFANWCRTRSRKYRDLLLPSTAVLSRTETGYTHVGQNFESADWESRLVAMALNDEDMLSVIESVEQEFGAAGIDPAMITETEQYTDEQGQTRSRPTAEARRGLELLEYVADGRSAYLEESTPSEGCHELTTFGNGKTIREALKSQQRTEARNRVRHTA